MVDKITKNGNRSKTGGCCREAGQDKGPSRPNILIIMADQHRYDCIGSNGNSVIKTPNLDRLASGGVRFTNAYTSIPVCCPARQSMLTGRRNEDFGALWNYNSALKTGALEPSEYSWARALKEAGYNTGHLGVWDVNPVHMPDEYGFEDYVLMREYNVFRGGKYGKQDFKNGFFGEDDKVPLEDSPTHWLAGRAVSLIRKYACDGGKPWQLSLCFNTPHPPCRPSGRFAGMYSPDDIPVWGNFGDNFKNKPYMQMQQLYNWGIEGYTWEDWAPVAARYYGVVSQMDDAVGMVLDELERLALAENTMVIYMSDHGDTCGAHRMMDKHYIMYDDVVRVPFIIRMPADIHSGRGNDDSTDINTDASAEGNTEGNCLKDSGEVRSSSKNTNRPTGGVACEKFIYSTLDLAPTVLDVAGIMPEPSLSGSSLLPLVRAAGRGDGGDWKENAGCSCASGKGWRKEVVSTYNGQQFGLYTQRMIRTEKWKYIWNTTDVDELYDLENDPNELVNLIFEERCAEMLASLRVRLRDELVKNGDGMIKSPWLYRQLTEGRKQPDLRHL